MMQNLIKQALTAFETLVDKLKEFYTSFGGMLVILSAAFSVMSIMQQLMLLLLGAIFVDLITGIMAYHYEWKAEGKPYIKGYLIQSSKLRQTYMKGASYLLVIGLVYFMDSLIFADVKITLGGIIKPFRIVEVFTTTLIGIEVWSNFENLKRMNIDILGGVMNILKKGWSIFKGAKNGEF